jgi:uncharacterized membrane protein YbaN (DUF454 family)
MTHTPAEDPPRQQLDGPDDLPLTDGPIRWVLLACGFVFVGLAAIGTVLPVLPTTPLLIVAAACFARSSPRFYRWLLSTRAFGPMIREWRATRSIPLRAKVWAVTLIVITGGSSLALFVDPPWAKLVMGATLSAVIVWILRRPTARRD